MTIGPSPSTVYDMPRPRPRATVRDGSRMSLRGKPSPPPAQMPAPPRSAPPDRPRSEYLGLSFLLSSVFPPRGPDQGSTIPTTCDSTADRGYPSTSPQTDRPLCHQPQPLLHSPSPSTTHPTPYFSGRRATYPATSAHSCDSFPYG